MGKLKILIAGLVLLSPLAARAELIDMEATTLDTSTGLEWLDLTVTAGLPYANIVGLDGLAELGFAYATLDQICELWNNAGAMVAGCTDLFPSDQVEPVSQASADLLVGLLGVTADIGSIESSAGYFDVGSLIGSSIPLLGLAAVNSGSRQFFDSGSTSPSVEWDRGWDVGGTEINPSIGHWLVRSVPESVPDPSTSVPEPGTLALLGAGLIGMGFARRRKAA